jgi:hypothetical protein
VAKTILRLVESLIIESGVRRNISLPSEIAI